MHSDTLVIGSGIAGLWAALKTAEHGTVTVLTKKEQSESSTNYAQGGIAGVMSADDDPDLHFKDTLEAGAGLCHEEAVRVLVTEGPSRIRDLIDFGANFTTEHQAAGERLALGREGGHSRRRIVFAKDLTGREIERALLNAVRHHPNIEVHENHIGLDLVIRDGECRGAVALDRQTREVEAFTASATVLATGGSGQVYLHTTNPAIATGDGVAMAWRAGADIANMEFIQFHPTTLCHPAARSFLISEAVRGEGAVLRLSDGSTFMEKYHPLASLAPRDVVARAIDAEVKARDEECAYLDATVIPFRILEDHFPNIVAKCREVGIDPVTSWIPVVPAAHYQCGGVVTDLHGRTTLPRLFASGEVSCTGVHGANRLASNSLLEAVVFSERAAESIEALSRLERPSDAELPASGAPEPDGVADLVETMRHVMWNHVAIVRDDAGLAVARDELQPVRQRLEAMYGTTRLTGSLAEARNMATVATLVIESAACRKESRGLHYSTDHPARNDRNWLRDTVLKKSEAA